MLNVPETVEIMDGAELLPNSISITVHKDGKATIVTDDIVRPEELIRTFDSLVSARKALQSYIDSIRATEIVKVIQIKGKQNEI